MPVDELKDGKSGKVQRGKGPGGGKIPGTLKQRVVVLAVFVAVALAAVYFTAP